VPLALVETTATSVPLDKGKGVVVLPSDDEEDSAEGQVFKRRRTAKVITSTSSSNHSADSLREHPPSATSPPQQLALEGGVESEPAQVASAPELPQPVQEMLRGYLHKVSPGGQSEGAKKEGMNFYLGAFMACANSWRDQARAKASEVSALQALEKECASLKEEKRRWERQKEAHSELLRQVVPLRVQVVDLKDAVEASKALQKKLEDHCVDREQKLAKTEAALEAKTKECELLEAKVKASDLLEAELRVELVKAFATKDEELASQAAHFKKTKEDLVQDAVSALPTGLLRPLPKRLVQTRGSTSPSAIR